VRRIDPVSLVTPQLGAREVPNLGGIDDTDDMTSLVQLTRDAETISPGGLQTGVNPSDLLTDQPIQEMAPSIRRIRKALCAHLVATRHARVERIFGNVDTQQSVDHYPILPLRLFSKGLRLEQPCTQDLRSRASQDTVQSKQRSLENGA